MNKTEKIAVLGAGSWGTALALVLMRAGNTVMLWGRDKAVVEEINTNQTNTRYLPGIVLAPSIAATDNLAETLTGAEIILAVTPAQTTGELTHKIAGNLDRPRIVVCCAKGIDRKTGKLPGQIIRESLPDCSISALSGPSFATDVARGLPTAVTIASDNAELSNRLAAIFSSAQFRCYASTDLKGVELGGALKNVIALAVGVARALQLGASAEAALIARGFAEITRLAAALGARPQTIAGLSGLGDLVLTCSGGQSRNFTYGLALGQGNNPDTLPLAEGAFTAGIAARIAEQYKIDAPIIEAVSRVLENKITPQEAVVQLLERPLKMELS
jgi:glycerol-3-phosphate dehydrogenase (NAD(P)+)